MSLEKAMIEELKNKLIEKKDKLKKDLGIIAEPIDNNSGEYKTRFEDIGEHKDENATEVESFVENIAIKENLEKQLSSVETALVKIEKDTFGICEKCGKEIREERLKINPSAKRCMKCVQ